MPGNPAATLFATSTAIAPASCAFWALTVKSQVPRAMTAYSSSPAATAGSGLQPSDRPAITGDSSAAETGSTTSSVWVSP